MTPRRFKTLAGALAALPLLLAACEVTPTGGVSASSEVSRLQSMGYRIVARSAADEVMVLRYTGPINASVQCGTDGNMGTIRPRVRAANGAIEAYKLNAYLVLKPGKDGLISSAERDGLYVVSKSTRASTRSRVSGIESISFGPGQQGSFSSGLSCRGN